MSEALYQIIYISTANDELTLEALLELLSGSQKRNASRQITGFLLHADGKIIQVLEGPEEAVRSLYSIIAADKRHRGVTVMSSRSIMLRDFPEFRMGFKGARSEDFNQELPGSTDAVENRSVSVETSSGLSKMVAIFIRTFAKTTRIDRFESLD
ncbi:MAG: BLUF domain-containing protein [Opitutales bacterium]